MAIDFSAARPVLDPAGDGPRRGRGRSPDGGGHEVQVVEIKDVEIPESMQRAMAREVRRAADQNSTVVFPLPVDIVTPFLRSALGSAGGEQETA